MKKRVYPDTNVALHFKRFDEIDWLTLVDATEVDLVVALVVMEELDSKKWEGARGIKQRARELYGWLGKLANGAEIRRGVRIYFEPHAPELSIDFRAEHLNDRSEDDRLLACILAATRADTSTPVVAVTADLAMMHKLRGRGLTVAEPAEKDQRQVERDEVAEENRRLKAVVTQMQAATAALQLTFEDGTTKRGFCKDPGSRGRRTGSPHRVALVGRWRPGRGRAAVRRRARGLWRDRLLAGHEHGTRCAPREQSSRRFRALTRHEAGDGAIPWHALHRVFPRSPWRMRGAERRFHGERRLTAAEFSGWPWRKQNLGIYCHLPMSRSVPQPPRKAPPGVIRARDAAEHGLSRKRLSELTRAGKLERVARGLYTAADAEVTEHHTLVEAAASVPHGVICLLSALRFHELGTQQPHEVWVAIGRKAWKPRLDWPPVHVVRFSGEALDFGVEEHLLENVSVRITSREKTVADCFKYRNKIGLDVALEALREYLRSRKRSVDDLVRAARVCRVARIMQPYLESMA